MVNQLIIPRMLNYVYVFGKIEPHIFSEKETDMYILHVTYEVKEGKCEAFLKELAALGVAEKSLAEDGCVDYTYYLPVAGGNTLFLSEVWESREAQAAHTKTAHFQALAGIKDLYVEKTAIVRFDKAVLSD